MKKGPYARHSVFFGVKSYIEHYNAADGTFYDAINFERVIRNMLS
jgi:hypothetical protein